MDNIISLTNRLSIQKVSRLRLLGQPMSTQELDDSRAHTAYNGIINGEITDDASCAKLLKLDVNSRYYVRFKREFYFKVLDHVVYIDPKTEKVDDSILYNVVILNKCIRIYHLYEIGERKLAKEFALKLLKSVKKLNSSKINLICLRVIKEYYLNDEPDIKLFKKYVKEYRKSVKITNAQNYAIYSSKLISSRISRGSKISEDDKLYCYKVLKKLENKLEGLEENTFMINTYLQIKLDIYFITKDSEVVFRYCKQLVKKLTAKKNKVFKMLIQRIYEHIILYSIQLSRFEETGKYLKIYKRENKTSKSKVRFLYFELFYLFQIKDYNKSIICYQKIRKFKHHFVLNFFEHLELFRAWLYLLNYVGHINHVENQKYFESFNVYSFKNNITVNAKDKKGVYAQVLVIECLYLLTTKKYEELYDKHSALSKYYFRYLKGEETRTSILFELIVAMSKNIFRPSKVIALFDITFKKLNKCNRTTENFKFFYEKVDYEDVIKFIISKEIKSLPTI